MPPSHPVSSNRGATQICLNLPIRFADVPLGDNLHDICVPPGLHCATSAIIHNSSILILVLPQVHHQILSALTFVCLDIRDRTSHSEAARSDVAAPEAAHACSSSAPAPCTHVIQTIDVMAESRHLAYINVAMQDVHQSVQIIETFSCFKGTWGLLDITVRAGRPYTASMCCMHWKHHSVPVMT